MRAFLPRFGQTNIDIMTSIFIDLASRSRAHEVTDDVEAADVILFTQAHAFSDWPHEIVRHLPNRTLFPAPCFTYDEGDMPWCQLPGLYVGSQRAHSTSASNEQSPMPG